MNTLQNKYKARKPEDTIRIIEKFFNDRNCTIKCNNKWHSEINTYSNEYYLYFAGKQILESRGKGTTELYAQASGYGELYERFCAFPVSCWNTLNYSMLYNTNMKKNNYALDKNEKKVTLLELLNNDFIKTYLSALNAKLDLEVIDKIFNIRLFKEIYTVPYKNISNDEIIYTIPGLHGLSSGSNGLAAGNTVEEALIQGISELYERYAQTQFYLVPENNYYFLNPNNLSQNIKELINNLNKLGYKVYIYDLSYNYNIPVCMTFIIHSETNHYYTHFGSFPILDIAIERCLTETYQEIDSLLDSKYNQGYTKLFDSSECDLNTITLHSTGAQPEIVINHNLITKSKEVDFYNNNIFLSSNDIENADILKRIERINQLNNINFYYWNLSLSDEMAAVHIVCDNFNYTNIDMMSLKEYNDIYQEDTDDFLLALDLGDQISTLLKRYINCEEANINIIDELNSYIEKLPTESIEHRIKILNLISSLFGTELMQPYYIWYNNNISNNIIIPYYMAGYIEDIDYDLTSDLAKKIVSYEFYYRYCIKGKHSLDEYNQIMAFLGNNLTLESDLLPSNFIEETIFKNFKEIYNDENHLKFINLFTK